MLISQIVCDRCGEPRSTDPSSICPRCARDPLPSLDGIRSAAYFENNPIRPAIHFLKYENHRAVVSILGELLAGAYRRYQLGTEVIIPVPLHTSRFTERGYNQSELLAHHLGQALDLAVDTTTLQRIRQTKPQVGLGTEERKQNVVNAFICVGNGLVGRKALLIDDVWTTGATMNACAAALKQNLVASVWGLTLARAGLGSA